MKKNRPFWQTTPLEKMSHAEWESLCDGCGLCCLHKLQDEDSDEIYYTQVACRLLDCHSCQCTNYPHRKLLVPECLKLDYKELKKAYHWLPESCAYRRLYLKEGLPSWHPLVSGDKNTVHTAKISVRTFAISEKDIDGDLEDYLL
ncbi:YcgN family cysteine cluster protein [Fangia hongkongensis]|uniref:YcgN family cysteine cluster protein n=1 Tax=Fangia hongkongensis TaxID=270495 RepID=UPI00039B5B18|nr:YcgN family cysteine cluster protein [Fangia hongkongensis]MBK2124820.1 YcgN family cysteine cluster protein [Fangia hongkongensis]